MAINLLDITTNNNDLTAGGTPTEITTALPFAQSTIAVQFDATGDYYTAADSASLSITGDMTLEFWIKLPAADATADGTIVLSKSNTTGNQRSWYVKLNYDTDHLELGFNISSNGADWSSVNTATGYTADTNWHHVAGVYTASAHTLQWYVDGSAFESAKDVTQTAIYNGSAVLAMNGTGDSLGGHVFYLDDVRVWNDVRTAGEINNNKSIELTGGEANLVAYWPFETVLGPPTTTPSGYQFFM